MGDYKICKYWSANNRKDNCCINLPKKYVEKHGILKYKMVIIRNTEQGILIQPFKAIVNLVEEDESK